MDHRISFLKKVCLAVLVICLFSACGGKEIEMEEALRNEIYAVHDEVMPKTSDINRLKARLNEYTLRDTVFDEAYVAEVKAAVTQLEKADDGMMRWMNEFKQPEKLRDSMSHEEIMAYLNNQKQQIGQVRDAMLGSIETATKLLKQE